MIYQTVKVVIVATTLAICGNVSAQDCNSCGQAVTSYGYGYANAEPDGLRCGRGITQARAAALWAGYCNESCDTDRHRRCRTGCFSGKHFGGNCGCTESVSDCGNADCSGGCGGGCGGGLFKGKLHGRRGASAGCCDQGCFGYPAATPCDTGGCGGQLFGGHHGNHDGCGTCAGCKLFGKCRNRCGSKGGFFHHGGNRGMQSCVSGCATDCCGGSVMMPTAGPNPTPAPPATNEIVGEGIPAPGEIDN